MKTQGLLLFSFVLLAAAITIACGSSPVSHIAPNCSNAQTGGNATGTLQSITVCPASADAKNFPDGQVQFVATGYYSAPPSPVTPLAAFWGACEQSAPTTAVSIKNGLAQCSVGASGQFSVFAADPTNCNAITACGGGCQVSGTAQLTCP